MTEKDIPIKDLVNSFDICNPQTMESEEEKYPEIEIVGDSMMHGDGKHEVLDLEQTKLIDLIDQVQEFETWVCMHRKCNYLEYRLKEGHREDR